MKDKYFIYIGLIALGYYFFVYKKSDTNKQNKYLEDLQAYNNTQHNYTPVNTPSQQGSGLFG